MSLDLKDKLAAVPVGFSSAAADLIMENTAIAAGPHDHEGGVAWQEAREALAALGYTTAELDRAGHALQGTFTPEETVDSLMKRVLQQLFKG